MYEQNIKPQGISHRQRAMTRATTEMKAFKAAQQIFREWCLEHGAVVDVEMAADLVRRIKTAIDAERERAALTAGREAKT